MPPRENSDKIIRYREHRKALTKFVDHRALAPKYSLFAELMLLWLDAKPDQEAKIWTCVLFYMGAPPKRRLNKEEYEDSEFTEESSIDRDAKERMTALVKDFLASEEDEPV